MIEKQLTTEDTKEHEGDYGGFQFERSQSGMTIQIVRAEAAMAVSIRRRRFIFCRPLKRARRSFRCCPTAYAVG